MSIGFVECISLGGNIKDMLGYMETLMEDGHDVNIYLTMSPYFPLSFEEFYKRWETSIPLHAFHYTEKASLKEISKFNIEEDELRIAGAPSLIKIPDKPDCQMSKIIFPFHKHLPKQEGTSYFTVSQSLSDLFDVPSIPRPIDYSVFYANRKNTPKYDITDTCVCHQNKKLEVFNELAKNYKVKIALSILAEWQENLISKYPNIEYIKNASKSEIAKLMGDSKICLHPSLSEQASVTIDEALCAGCFLIARDTVSYQEQIANKYGYVLDTDVTEQIDKVLAEDTPSIREERATYSFEHKDRRFIRDKWLKTIREELERVK